MSRGRREVANDYGRTILQKYDFKYGRSKGRIRDSTANSTDFAVNRSYISVR